MSKFLRGHGTILRWGLALVLCISVAAATALGNRLIRTLLFVYTLALFGSGATSALFVFFLAHDLHAPQAAIGLFPVVLGIGLAMGSVLDGVLARPVGLTRLLWTAVIAMELEAIALFPQTSLVPGLVLGFVLEVSNGISRCPTGY